jgi:hypothetical protein
LKKGEKGLAWAIQPWTRKWETKTKMIILGFLINIQVVILTRMASWSMRRIETRASQMTEALDFQIPEDVDLAAEVAVVAQGDLLVVGVEAGAEEAVVGVEEVEVDVVEEEEVVTLVSTLNKRTTHSRQGENHKTTHSRQGESHKTTLSKQRRSLDSARK